MSNTKVVHVSKAPYDVYIGRAMPGKNASKWGNPFKSGRDGDLAAVLERYRQHVLASPELMASLEELRGQTLGCWCKPRRCHGDILVELLGEAGSTEPVADNPQGSLF